MDVENKRMKVGVLLVAILVCGFVGAYFYRSNSGRSDIVAERGQTFLFVNPVSALGASSETTFLEEEAGMSIYVDVGQSLDLSVAETVYKTIEEQTLNYIVGSFSLPDLPETEDVHCFVHKDGWIVVYYLKNEPISKIIDWNYYSGGKLTKTKFQVGLEKMGLALGVTVTGAKYYNFQYPYADKWMIVIESKEDEGEDSFNIKIPSEFTIYERSWSHYGSGWYTDWYSYGYAIFKINETQIDSISETGVTRYGQLTITQLEPNVFYTISTSSELDSPHRVAIVLAYREA